MAGTLAPALEAEIISSLAHGRSTTAVAAKLHIAISIVEAVKAQHGPDLGALAAAAERLRGGRSVIPEDPPAVSGETILERAEKVPSLAAKAAKVRALMAELVDGLDAAEARAKAEDLVARRREELRKAEELLAKVKGSKAKAAEKHDDSGAIRAWAKAQGLVVSAAGRIPEAIRVKYEERER